MKKVCFFLLACCIVQQGHAQLAFTFDHVPVDLSLHVGPSFFLGDLGGNFNTGKGFVADLNLPSTRYFAGATATIFPAQWLGLRGALNMGELYGNDAYSDGGDDGRKKRNLDFRTNIEEGYVGMEVYPLDMLMDGLIHPYGVIGAGLFHFNPQGSYTSPITGQTTWVNLRPLHTEGEGWGPGYPKEYNLWQPVIPVGVGLKINVSPTVSLSGELLYRFIFTGYLDDVHGNFVQDPSLFYQHLPPAEAALAVAMANKSGYPVSDFSTRGDPNRTNAYFSIDFGIHITLGQYDSWFSRAAGQVRCPTRW